MVDVDEKSRLTFFNFKIRIIRYTQAKSQKIRGNLMSFKDLKKQSSLGSLTQKLVKEVEKMNTTSGRSR